VEILDSVEACLDQAFQKLEDKDFSRNQVVAVGITNQRETTILWDKTTGD
jgi:glycerol kinase